MNFSAKFWNKVAADYSRQPMLGLNVLHLLENKEAVIRKVYNMLQPGGFFITSTVCLGDTTWFNLIAPIGKFLRLFPLVRGFTMKDLEKSLTNAGFAIDYQWQAGDYKLPIGKANIVFMVSKKDLSSTAKK